LRAAASGDEIREVQVLTAPLIHDLRQESFAMTGKL
jgi:hypothetical protein